MECLLKQAKATAKLYGEDSFAKGVQSQIARLFETLNLESQNLCLSPQDKAKFQTELREFFTDKNIVLEADFEIPPTLLAVQVYEKISTILGVASPYQALKNSSIATAREYKKGFLEILRQKLLQERRDELAILTYALKICVLGNVLDYGAQCQFDLEVESQKILSANFAYFDVEKFAGKLKRKESRVYRR